jgi:ABC-type multidrug transport system permease subunit
MRAIFLKDLRLLLRDPTALLLSLVAPLVMITVITLARARSADPPHPLIPVVDLDEGPVARTFIELLGRNAAVTEMARGEAEHLVRDLNRAPAAIVFPPGLSKRYLQGKPTEIELLTDPAQSVALDALHALLLVMDRDAAELADPLYEPLLVYREENLTGTQLSPKAVEQNVPGFTIMFVLLAVVIGTASAMHDERNWGTLTRLLAAPGGMARLLVGKLGLRGAVGLGQAMALLVWGHLVLGLSLGPSAWALVALMTSLAFAAAALGLLVAAIATTREQTLPLSLAATVGLAALCGLWWPLSLVPPWLRSIGELFFPAWVMDAMSDLVLRDRRIDAIIVPLALTVAEGALVLGLGLWLFRVRQARR